MHGPSEDLHIATSLQATQDTILHVKRKKRGKENHDILFEKIYSKVLVRNDVKPNLCSHYTASTRESTAHLCTLFVDLSKEGGLFQDPV